jgi:hypothetical protein
MNLRDVPKVLLEHGQVFSGQVEYSERHPLEILPQSLDNEQLMKYCRGAFRAVSECATDKGAEHDGPEASLNCTEDDPPERHLLEPLLRVLSVDDHTVLGHWRWRAQESPCIQLAEEVG